LEEIKEEKQCWGGLKEAKNEKLDFINIAQASSHRGTRDIPAVGGIN